MDKEARDSKPKYGLMILIILLICGAGVLGWYLGSQSKDKVKGEKNETKEETPKEETESPKETNVTFDKSKANEYLKTFSIGLVTLDFANEDNIIPKDKRNNSNLLDANAKLKLGWYYLFVDGHYDSSKVYEEVSPDGEGETGDYGVDLTYFKNLYKELFDEEIPSNADYTILGFKTPIKNNILYGSMYTGMPVTDVVLKANSITLKDNQYELLIDVLEFKSQEDIGEYDNPSTITYDESLISYKIKVTYEVKSSYVLKSIVAYE